MQGLIKYKSHQPEVNEHVLWHRNHILDYVKLKQLDHHYLEKRSIILVRLDEGSVAHLKKMDALAKQKANIKLEELKMQLPETNIAADRLRQLEVESNVD